MGCCALRLVGFGADELPFRPARTVFAPVSPTCCGWADRIGARLVASVISCSIRGGESAELLGLPKRCQRPMRDSNPGSPSGDSPAPPGETSAAFTDSGSGRDAFAAGTRFGRSSFLRIKHPPCRRKRVAKSSCDFNVPHRVRDRSALLVSPARRDTAYRSVSEEPPNRTSERLRAIIRRAIFRKDTVWSGCPAGKATQRRLLWTDDQHATPPPRDNARQAPVSSALRRSAKSASVGSRRSASDASDNFH